MNNINTRLFGKVFYANGLKTVLLIFLMALLVCSFSIAVFHEPTAKLLTSVEGWSANVVSSGQVPLYAFPEQFRQVRRSAVESPGGQVYRTWTPDKGIVPLELTSAPFRPAHFMSVAITGANRTPDGRVHAYIECEQNGQRLEIFRGSVNVNVAEAIVILPEGWCPGDARLKFISSERNTNVGVGSVFEISYLSCLKSSFIGRVPYFLTALAIYSLMMLAGASLAARLGWYGDPLPIAFVSLGAASLGIFYFASGIPAGWRWICFAVVSIATVLTIVCSGHVARSQAARALAPYARVWTLASLVYFAVLCMTTNGLGHWEPNYRFWPAIWSSDNELSWMFAEAIRHGSDLKGLFGGGWMPTDRPPLMTGAHLLLADAFSWLQAGNDGTYLRGQAYNAAAVTLNALWVPAAWWLLSRLRHGIDDHGRTEILVLVGCLPFVLFNTVYGWPKAFGAAFALVAFGLAWQSRERDPVVSPQSTIALFFVLGAFSMLAHASTALFLAPLGLLFLWWTLRRNTHSVLIGFAIALSLLASWSLYKLIVLPSADPVTKYALTGDFGFGHPDWSLWQMLSSRYGRLDFLQWLEIKKIMLLQVFLPLHHSVTQIGLNSDFGAGTIDKLRAWDFMLLSKGNLAVPFLVVLAIWAALSNFSLRRLDQMRMEAPFLTLIGVSLVAWLLLVIGFFAPPIIHHWPQAALFGLALGGAVIVQSRYPVIFGITLLAVMSYTGLVWILSPLQSALGIDAGAALVLAALGSWALMSSPFHRLLRAQENSRSSTGGDFSLSAIAAGLKDNSTLRQIGNAAAWTLALRVITVGALLFVSYITFRYIQQPIVDVHAFRQTQTALTAYWMLHEGWALAYQSPVSGFPWAIPFEFPIYQALVAAIVALSGFDLEAVGRFVSYAFLVACAWPAFALSRRLDLPKSVPWVFCALLWTSPINVYWGRTFMIETAALFFSLACMPYAIDLIRRVGGWRSVLLFIAFATAAVLQKATTGGPVLLFLFFAAVFVHFRQHKLSYKALRALLYPMIVIGIPLSIGLAWAHYADVVKMDNPFGTQLTSKNLTTWNFGSMEQKLDFETWRLVVWDRSLRRNAGGLLGVLLLLLPWFGRREHRRFAWLSLGALVLFVLPVLIFTNLHFVHEYYQVACVAFLLAALAIVIGGWLKKASGIAALIPIVTAVLVLFNITEFYSAYGIVTARTLDEQDSRSVQAFKVGYYLREHTRPGTGLVIFGQGFSSEIGFQSQRKSMTVPPNFKEYHQLWEQPQKYLGNLELSAIVICPPTNDFPNITDLQARIAKEPSWIHATVYGCEMLLSPNTQAAN